MALTEHLSFHSRTHVGRSRKVNEDNYLINKRFGLALVADGMGGHAAGEIASAACVRIIDEEMTKVETLIARAVTAVGEEAVRTCKEVASALESAVKLACRRVYESSVTNTERRGMGTTLSALLMLGTQAVVAHVGDSRIYLIRGGEKALQLTDDHTFASELKKKTGMTDEQISRVRERNAITRAVGVYPTVEVDITLVDVLPGDQFLLVSDGLTTYVKDEELPVVLQRFDGDRAVEWLIDEANERGGRDNITAVIVRVGARDDASRQAEELKLTQKREALRSVPLFSKLSDKELMRVMQSAFVRTLRDGQLVYREGDDGAELYIILKGQVRVEQDGAPLVELARGEHFGEIALVRNMPRSVTVTATTATDLLVIQRRDFFEILRTESELAVKLLWQFVGVLADRLDQASLDLTTARRALIAEDVSESVELL